MARRSVSDAGEEVLTPAEREALRRASLEPSGPSLLDLLPVPAAVRRPVPAIVPPRASLPGGGRLRARDLAPSAAEPGRLPTQLQLPQPRRIQSPSTSIAQEGAEGLARGAQQGLTYQALRGPRAVHRDISEGVRQSVQPYLPQRERDREALLRPPAPVQSPDLTWGEALGEIAGDLGAGRTEGMAEGAARAIGEGAGQVMLDPLGDALGVAGLRAAGRVARQAPTPAPVERLGVVTPPDGEAILARLAPPPAVAPASVGQAERRLANASGIDIATRLTPPPVAPPGPVLRVPGAAQVGRAVNTAAEGALDVAEGTLQAVAPFARRLAADESGNFNLNPNDWPRARRTQGADLPDAERIFNARNWREMEPQAQDRARDFMGRAAQELEPLGLGPNSRMTAETVQRLARAMPAEEVEALTERFRTGEPLNIIETRAAQLALEDVSERASAISRQLSQGGNALSEAERTRLRSQLADLDRQELQLAKSVGFSETEKGRALNFLRVLQRRGFDPAYWARVAQRATGGQLPDEVGGRIVDLTRRGRELERELGRVDPEAMAAAQARRGAAEDATAAAEAENQALRQAESEAGAAERAAVRAQTEADFNAIMGRLEDARARKAEAEARAQAVAPELAELRAAEAEAARAAKAAERAETQADFNAIMGRLEEARAAKAEAEARLTQARAEIQALREEEAELRRLERELQRERNRLEAERARSEGNTRTRQQIEDDLTGVRAQLRDLMGELDVATPLETLMTARKAGLLTGIGTTTRNTLSNTLNIPLEEFARLVAGTADAASVATGTATRRVQVAPSARAIARAVYEAATRGLREADEVIRYGATASDLRNADNTMEFYSGRPIIDGFINTTFRFLSAQDRIFRAYAFRRSVDEVAQAEALNWRRAQVESGTTPTRAEFEAYRANLENNPSEAMLAEALWSSERAVFANTTGLAEGVSKTKARLRAKARLGDNLAGFESALLDAVLPFTNTPASIYYRMLEYTPGVGQAFDPRRSSLRARRAARPSPEAVGLTDQEMRHVRMLAARQMTGTGLIYAGYQLGARGRILPGYSPSDRDKNRTAGMAPSSIRIGDTWVPLNPFAPGGLMLSIGAQLAHASGGQVDLADAPFAAALAATELAKTPMFQGVAQMAATINSSEDAKLAAVANYVGQLAGSFVPSILADAARASDPIQRDARAGLAFDNPQAAAVVARIAQRIPGFREQLPPSLDAFGRVIQEPGGWPGLVAARDRRDDPVANRLLAVGADFPRERKRVSAGDAATESGSPNIDLTPDQRGELTSMTGALTYSWLSSLMQGDEWAEANDAERKRLAEDVIHDAMAEGLRLWRQGAGASLGGQAADAQERARLREERRRAQGLPEPQPWPDQGATP